METLIGGRMPAWFAGHDALVFTLAALQSEPEEKALEPLAARLIDALGDHEAITLDGFALRRRALAASAAVAHADAMLDSAIAKFARDVMAVPGDAGRALYDRLFPEHHVDVIELGLDAEVPVAALILRLLEEDESIPEGLRAQRDALRSLLQRANGALTERAEAYALLGRHQARVDAWLESANGMQRGLRRTLHGLAESTGRPSRWALSFFRTPPSEH